MSAAPGQDGRPSPQIGRIARLLKVDPDDVHGLDGLPDDALRELHDQISQTLFSDGHHRFARIAGLSKALPGPIAGRLAERFLPAELAARVAELLEPARARDLVGRVSVPYLADIALALDPVRSRPVVQQIPARRVGQVTRELFDRREYAAMAEFVGTVTVEALHVALGVATGRDLLAVVPLLEWTEALDRVVAELDPQQVDRIVAELDTVSLAELALALDPSRFGPIVTTVPVEVAVGIAEVLFERGEHAAMARFVTVVTTEMLPAVLTVASADDLVAIAPLIEWDARIEAAFEQLAPTVQARLFDQLDRMSADHQRRIRAAAEAGELGPVVGALVARRD